MTLAEILAKHRCGHFPQICSCRREYELYEDWIAHILAESQPQASGTALEIAREWLISKDSRYHSVTFLPRDVESLAALITAAEQRAVADSISEFASYCERTKETWAKHFPNSNVTGSWEQAAHEWRLKIPASITAERERREAEFKRLQIHHCPWDVDAELGEGDPLPEPHCHADRDGNCKFAYCPQPLLTKAAQEPGGNDGR